MASDFSLSCPPPVVERKQIVLGHGSGGRLSAQLLREVFLPAFDNELLRRLDDQAVFPVAAGRLAFTTDAFVVTPLFFPGGNIGDLAVNGTVNDLAMSGAKPLYLSAAFIMEEGFPLEDLSRIVETMAAAASAAGVHIVTGDTKVVNRGSADKLFVTTTGIGAVPEGISLSAAYACPGDRILLSGSIGDHGMAIMSCREGLEFASAIRSDTAPLHRLVERMLAAGEVHAMRDPTRGGLGTSLHEIAAASHTGMEIDAIRVPVCTDVKAACELLGLDPLFVANEGKLVAFVPERAAEAVLAAMRGVPEGSGAVEIGRVVSGHPGVVIATTEVGGTRVIDLPFHEQLPRIC